MELIHTNNNFSYAVMYNMTKNDGTGNITNEEYLKNNCQKNKSDIPINSWKLDIDGRKLSFKSHTSQEKKYLKSLGNLGFKCYVDRLCGYPLFCKTSFLSGTSYKVIYYYLSKPLDKLMLLFRIRLNSRNSSMANGHGFRQNTSQ